MGINTGDLTHLLRQAELPSNSTGVIRRENLPPIISGNKNALRPVLSLANTTHSLLGTSRMTSITRKMHNVWGLPQWTPAMPMSYKIQEGQQQGTGCKEQGGLLPQLHQPNYGIGKILP